VTAGKVKARERIAVLAALNLAYQLAETLASAARARRRGSSAADVDVDALVRRIDARLERRRPAAVISAIAARLPAQRV
jgi:cell division protein ZapA